jgi:Putative beta-barrel porin-2, OmpL-like. bbp2
MGRAGFIFIEMIAVCSLGVGLAPALGQKIGFGPLTAFLEPLDRLERSTQCAVHLPLLANSDAFDALPVTVQLPPEPAQPTESTSTKPGTADSPTPAASAPSTTQPTPDRWLLMRTLQGSYPGALLADYRMQVLGWTDVGFTGSTDRRSNLPMGFNYRANEPVLQQNWLRVERTVVTTGTTEPTFGFRTDTILPGSDYRFTLARGLFDRQLTANDGQPSIYGIDPVQFYAEAYFPTVWRGLDVKVGRFYAQYGVQSIEAPNNALYSHTYTFLDNPFTQTGIVATATLTDMWTVQAGLVNGDDVFISPGMAPTFIGSVKWTSPDQRSTATLATILGSGRFNEQHNLNNANLLDLIFTHKVSARLTYTFESLTGYETGVPDIGTARWIGVVNYLTYTLTPRLSGTARVEFWDDPQGLRTGFRGLYSVPTLGMQFKLRSDVVIRPEIRFDYNDQTRPFEGHHGMITAGTDLILRW